jgi:predicted aspartyl protease
MVRIAYPDTYKHDACLTTFTDNLKELLGGDKDVEEVKGSSFEKQYKKVVDAVRGAGNGDVKVFKVQIDGTRAEFYVVAVDEKEGRVVGLKALSVES